MSLVAYPAIAVVALVAHRLRGVSFPRIIFGFVFAVYCIEALKATLFPIPVDGVMAEAYADRPFLLFLNVVPVVDWVRTGLGRQEILNVLLGVPLGGGLWFVLRRPSTSRVMLLGAVASLAVELTQFAIGAMLGFMYRVVDVNDVLLNSMGVAIGCLAFHAFASLARLIDRRDWSLEGATWQCLREVVGTDKT